MVNLLLPRHRLRSEEFFQAVISIEAPKTTPFHTTMRQYCLVFDCYGGNVHSAGMYFLCYPEPCRKIFP